MTESNESERRADSEDEAAWTPPEVRNSGVVTIRQDVEECRPIPPGTTKIRQGTLR